MSIAIDEVWTKFHEMDGTEQKAWLTQVMAIIEQQQDAIEFYRHAWYMTVRFDGQTHSSSSSDLAECQSSEL